MPKAQSANGREAYREREVPQNSTNPASTAKDVCASGEDSCIVLHSLKKQLEALRGDMDHLNGEVDMSRAVQTERF